VLRIRPFLLLPNLGSKRLIRSLKSKRRTERSESVTYQQKARPVEFYLEPTSKRLGCGEVDVSNQQRRMVGERGRVLRGTPPKHRADDGLIIALGPPPGPEPFWETKGPQKRRPRRRCRARSGSFRSCNLYHSSVQGGLGRSHGRVTRINSSQRHEFSYGRGSMPFARSVRREGRAGARRVWEGRLKIARLSCTKLESTGAHFAIQSLTRTDWG